MKTSCAAIFGASGGIGSALALELASQGVPVFAGSRSGSVPSAPLITPFFFDYDDEASIARAIAAWHDTPPDLVIVASGVLSLPSQAGAQGQSLIGPERSYKGVDAQAMARVLALNTIGPALVAKHVLGQFARDRRCVFAALSARVGSISDNRIGGWHSYRASKAALNMLLCNFAIEMGRTHKQAIIAGLHPGTVDTKLSQPFQKNLPEGQLTSAQESARHLLSVVEKLSPRDSGHVFDWSGERVPA